MMFDRRREYTVTDLARIAGANRRSVQHWAHFSKDAPSFSSLGHGHIAFGHCCSMSRIINEIIRVYRSIT